MDSRRYIVFLVLSMAILIGWMQLFAPKPVPNRPPAGEPEAGAAAEPGADDGAVVDGVETPDARGDGAEGEPVAGEPAAGENPPATEGADPADAEADTEAAAGKPPAEDAADNGPPRYEPRLVELGSRDPESGYFLMAEVDSAGAALSGIYLNDPRYSELSDRKRQLRMVGNGQGERSTFATAVSQIDAQLAPWNTSLATADWKLVGTEPDPELKDVLRSVTFEYAAPKGGLVVRKTYRVHQASAAGNLNRIARDTETTGYEVDLELTIHNSGNEPQVTEYILQGPVGLPLENAENSRKFLDVQTGFMDDDQSATPIAERKLRTSLHTAAEIVEFEEEETVPVWKSAVRYIGVDTQYFAALIIPASDQLQDDWIATIEPMVVKQGKEPRHSDVSVRLASEPLRLDAGKEVTHTWQLYAGPKRDKLLEQFGAEDIQDLGVVSPVSRGMLWLLQSLHGLGIPYGLAIICLTIIVRGALFPLSRKQAIGARKMKELQPKIAELKKKYGEDKEKLARAQMELFSKNNYNPLAGCLPLFLQLPIFIGLYNALNSSVDLRMASFLWVDNLAAPDALIRDIGFRLPYLGSSLNLLPIITVVLFVVQQKMFMPAPAPDDEQAQMQYKMMNFMMLFMGFMFYHVPAGLCVYFIASSLWGMGERKMLDYGSVPDAENGAGADRAGSSDKGSSSSSPSAGPGSSPADGRRRNATDDSDGKKPGGGGFLSRLLAQADAAADPRNSQKRDTSRQETRRNRRSKPQR